MTDDLCRLLDAADAAAPGARITHRDGIAAHGIAAIRPMTVWVTEDRHGHFAVRVIEHIGRLHPAEALAAPRALTAGSPSALAEAREAAARLAPSSPTTNPRATAGRASGTLGPEYRAGAPFGQLCEFPTQRGAPCGNPANYLVDGLWSCSRDHRGNPWRTGAGRAG